jgi:hypothetical protein
MKLLSKILVLSNVFTLFIICALCVNGLWYLIPVDIVAVLYIFKFYFYTHKDEHLQYELWRKEFEKEWNYLGTTNDYYQEEVWENKETGERIYI